MKLFAQDEREMSNGSVSKCSVKTLSKTILYYTVTFGLLGLLFTAIINTFITYNKWPIYTEVLVVPQNEAKYPAITMCPISDGYKEHVLQVCIPDEYAFYSWLLRQYVYIILYLT